ncbi:MAG: thiol-disulfide oxidoreductase family protein [Bacteroidetes bacterium]|jgi:predicted DCC family thiol-disulfide oxidoreductase YuxK|nr:thiol-disulfide oxidoreductase family protein [Bacteroidota bacterium]MDF2450785.1 thiol-disulfide oxidoreductase family protein [Bacteroidota bacterium]
MKSELKDKTILLFDGYCNLCHSSVQFVLDHEKKSNLYFASLQSPVGIELMNEYSIDPKKTDSLVLIEDNKAYVKSSAALRLAKHLKGAYPLAFGFMIVPTFIRNSVYDFIARNRYKWFGKKDNCMVPNAELNKRFL